MLLPRFLPSFPVICAYFCWHIQSMVNIHAVIHFGLHVDMDRWKDLHQCLSRCHTRLSWLLLAYTTTYPTSLHAAASTWIFCLQYLTKTEVSVKLQLQASKHPSKDQQVTSYGLCPFFFHHHDLLGFGHQDGMDGLYHQMKEWGGGGGETFASWCKRCFHPFQN